MRRVRIAIAILSFGTLTACTTYIVIERPEPDTGSAPDGGTDATAAPDAAGTLDAGPGRDAVISLDDAAVGFDGGPDAATLPPLGVTTGTLDLSCLAHATLHPGGAPTGADVHVTEFVMMSAITSGTLQVFANDVVGASCGVGCSSGITNGSGHATSSAPAGADVALHLAASSQTVEVLGYGVRWPAAPGGTIEVSGFSTSSVNLIASLLGRTAQPTDATLLGTITDCSGQTLSHALARVFVGSVEIVTGPSSDHTSPRITGLSGTSPTRDGRTGTGGTFLAVNVPASTAAHVELWGARSAGASDELIACEPLELRATALSQITLGPLRGDYVAGSACDLARTAAGH